MEQEQQAVERLVAERKTWYQQALATDAEPYIRLAAVLVPPAHPLASSK